LDTGASVRVRWVLVASRAGRGMTLLSVTYDSVVASRADRTLHMRDGRLVPPDESLRPAEQVRG
jgi:predicted ABC-type transport system involved in lysophospholipase L1 biosynthesis ATPase subunit